MINTVRLGDKIANTWIDQLAHSVYNRIELAVMRFYQPPELINLIKELWREDQRLLTKPSELAMIHSLASAQRRIEGEYAEVGVYRGGSAKMICAAKDNKPLHLFDTFSGIPSTRKSLDVQFKSHMFDADIATVTKRLRPYDGVRIYPGHFPITASPLKKTVFSFVHLGVDIYQSTIDALEFFYPRLATFGIILSHDYSSAAGVRKAFDDFLKDRREILIRLPMSQCMVIKQ
jgi:O-methyltransferase